MPEPNTTAAACAAGGFAAALCGTSLGAHHDALLGAFVGGLISLMYQPPMSLPRMAVSVGTSTLFAAILAPLGVPAAAAGAARLGIGLDGLAPHAVPLAVAMLLGIAAQVAIPAGLALLKRKGDAQ